MSKPVMVASVGPYHYVWKPGTDKDVDGFLIHDVSLKAFMDAGYLVNDPADDYGEIENSNPTKYFVDIYGNVPPVPADLPSFFARRAGTTNDDMPVEDPRVEPFADAGGLGPLG